MQRARRRRSARAALWFALIGLGAAACGAASPAAPDAEPAVDVRAADATPADAPAPADQAASLPLRPVARVATQNAGTTMMLEILGRSPHRATCRDHYDNNLCLRASELELSQVVAADLPDILFLQEIWSQERCAAADRPAVVNEDPFVCSAGARHQLERVLPDDYRFGCAVGYPDNCIAFRADAFVPASGDAGRDVSAALHPLEASCGRPGRIATLLGETALGATLLVVVHTNAGPRADDLACRAAQLTALSEHIRAQPEGTVVFMGGDVNMDPAVGQGPDVDAFRGLVATTGLARLPDDGNTVRTLAGDLDVVLTRHWPPSASASCHVRFADEGAVAPMFDHAFVSCR